LKYNLDIFTQNVFKILFSFADVNLIFNNLVEILNKFLNIPPQILFVMKEKDDFPFNIEKIPERVKVFFEKDFVFFKFLENSRIIIKEEEKRFESIYSDKKKIVKEFEKLGYDAVVGIVQRDKVIGAIFLKSKETGSVFTFKDQLLLTNLGYQLGIAVENMKLYHQFLR